MGRLSCWHLQRQICPCEATKGKLEVEPLNPAGGMAALTKRCIRKDPGPADDHDIFLAHMILINYDWLITCLYHSQSETIPSDMVGILVFNFITPNIWQTLHPLPGTGWIDYGGLARAAMWGSNPMSHIGLGHSKVSRCRMGAMDGHGWPWGRRDPKVSRAVHWRLSWKSQQREPWTLPPWISASKSRDVIWAYLGYIPPIGVPK